MKIGILGLLAGSFLFVSGLRGIDNNYTVEYWPERTQQLYFAADEDVPESMAFLRGIAGSSLITLSVKHLWNQRKPKIRRDPVNKFRESLQVFLGVGLMAAGFELKDLGPRYDQTVLFRGNRALSDPAVDHQKEYYGFMIGAVGSAMTTYSANTLWEGKRANLNQGYAKFHQHLEQSYFLNDSPGEAWVLRRGKKIPGLERGRGFLQEGIKCLKKKSMN
ncbi:MAG: hypothetical protein J4F39_14100 [Candidatus Latescibacteria bacterium]|nr:hypothetical protein [Candidatus Latescibacterota bacterium]